MSNDKVFGKIDKNAAVGFALILAMLVGGLVGSQFGNAQYGDGSWQAQVDARLDEIDMWMQNQNWTTGAGVNPLYPYKYMVFNITGTYYMRNGLTSVVTWSSTNYLAVCQACNNNLSTAGGLVILLDMEKPAGLTIGSKVVFEAL